MKSLAERLWSKVDMRGHEECWQWVAAKTADGYGRIALPGRPARHRAAHRVAYELSVGPIPRGLPIDHVRARGCSRRDCCNPAHLEAVTNRENTMCSANFVAINARKTTCPRGHAYDRKRPEGDRYCRTCNADHARAYRRRLGSRP